MRRALALLLALALLVGILPAAVAAGTQQTPTDAATVEAVEVEGVSRLDEKEASGGERAVEPLYAEDEMVTVIVQLEEPALMDYYGVSAYAALEEETASAGEAASAFLASDDVQALSQELRESQDSVLLDIRAAVSDAGVRSAARSRSSAMEVVSQYTTLVNAVAVKAPYGKLDEIQNLDGVKRAYVSHTYSVPEEPAVTPGTEGYTYDMVGLGEAWTAGYTGDGMVVAVLDTGLDLEYSSYYDETIGDNVTNVRRCHEAFREDSFLTDASDLSLRFRSEDYMAGYLSGLSDSLHAMNLYAGQGEGIYKNRKVPFAFDYAGVIDPQSGDLIMGDVNVYPGSEGSNHGTHVAGTIAGYAKDEEGVVKFSGVAPDAQLLMMKVFDDDSSGGASEVFILNALEDAVMLGADVINLSLGSDNGFSEDDSAAAEAYAKAAAAGVVMMTSAGNSAYAGTSNNLSDDYYPAANPDSAMMSAPAIYDSNLAVASINGQVKAESILVWNDGTNSHEAAFSDYWEVAMKQVFGGDADTDLQLKLYDCGYGTYDDYSNAGLGSKYDYSTGTSTFNFGVALVKRGGTDADGKPISFEAKINNATQFNSYNGNYVGYDYVNYRSIYEYPIKAVIIYDSDPEATELITMSVGNTLLESCFISGKDGQAMIDAMNGGSTVTLTRVVPEDRISAWDEAGQMSVFSSWGAGPGLELKPEITAPGGNVWSSVFDVSYEEGAGAYTDYDGAYGMMSGTSMAAPHMSGIGALVRQYVTENYPGADAGTLTQQLLVSTALPQKDANGVYYSPRQQGAGLVHAGAAVTTPAYLTTEGQTVGKLELGDDPGWTGEFDVSFTVHNISSDAHTYSAQIAVLRPDTETENGVTLAADHDVPVKTIDLGSVTVAANGSAVVNGTITLTADEIAALKALFPNGTYLEGFIILTGTGEEPQIGLPFLGFLGDWTAAPIFDSALWIDGCTGDENDPAEKDAASPWEDGNYVWQPSILGSSTGYGYYNLGQNVFDDTAEANQTVYHRENLFLSPNDDLVLGAVDDFILYQLRDAKLMVVEVTDAETGELYFRDYQTYLTRTSYWSEYDAPIPTSAMYGLPVWEGTDLDGSVLPSGTKVNYTITAYGEGDYGQVEVEAVDYLVSDFEGVADGTRELTFNGHGLDMTGDVISVPITIDTVAPKLENSAVTIYEADGRVYMTGTVFDEDGSLASIEVVPIVTRDYNATYQSYYGSDPVTKPDYSSAFYTEHIYDPALKTTTFTADVTEYVHQTIYNEYGYSEDYLFDYTWSGDVYLFCGDYGGNDRAYGIAVQNMTGEGLLLSTTSAQLHVGDTFDLSVVNNTGSDAAITRTSGNPEVATIDEYGTITALAPGQTVITVSNGSSSAVCIVTVEEYPTEVLDFKLSLDHFSTLTPDGAIVVKVVDLYPADVILDEIRWEVSEDDETAENYEGLVTCAQYSSDGLTGEIYLNYSVYDSYNQGNPPVPAGSGTLTVTLNGVSRSMTLDWAALYKTAADDGLVSAAGFDSEQTVYVTQGETASLVARYRQPHSVIDVKLYTAQGANNYGYSNPTTEAAGLILDGPEFAANGAEWTGRLVTKEGYTLPDHIQVGTRYSDGYEYWMDNSYTTNYTYDSETGEIWVAYAPYGSDSVMVIRADGVETAGAPGGELSGETYTRPDGTYGPFDWTVTDGSGTLETFENVNFGTYSPDYRNGAYYTPSEPGVSYIRAVSKDGLYSIDFAVICEGVKAETLDLNVHDLSLEAGETAALVPTYDPEPTLEADKELIWTSFNPEAAAVDENGVVTAVSAGYAFIKVSLKTNTKVSTYCIVTVTGSAEPEPVWPILPVYPGTGSGGTSSKPAASLAFTDVNTGDWFYDAVKYVYDEGLMNGVSDTRFAPESTLTRAMVVTILYRIEGEPFTRYSGMFPDVADGQWYTDGVEWAAKNRIVTGYTTGKFGPDDPVTREQLAAILYRYAQSKGYDVTASAELGSANVSEYAVPAVKWAVAEHILLETGSLRPRDAATRAEVAQAIAAFHQRYVK